MTQEEINDLIKRYKEDNCSPEEEKMIDEFLNSYQNDDGEWNENLLGNKKETENRIYSTITERIHFPDKKPAIAIQWWYRTAAALMILSSFFYLFSNTSNESRVKTETPEPLVVKTISRGQKSMLHLSDGSVIYMNSDTKISYPGKFAMDKREIYLDGEAFFEVTHDPGKPFIVHTGTLDIKVLGTSFNVNTFDEKVTVTLASGKVHIQNTNPAINYSNLGILIPNQQFIYDKADNSIKVKEVDVTPFIAWTKKQLIFSEETILSVVKRLEKWYGVEITFETNDIKNCIFTGTFDNEPLRLVLESLHNVADINYTIKGKKVRLSGPGCSNEIPMLNN